MGAPRKPKTPNPSAPNKVFVRKDPQAWKRKGWTSSPNSIIHAADMHPMEIWAWIWLASHTETFELNAQALADANEHVGRDKAYELVNKLEARGLLLRVYERTESGVPFMVYDLQPEPVPTEQRTAKPSKAKPRKSSFKKKQATADSCTVRNPGVTSTNTEPEAEGGFLHGQESGRDQHEHGTGADGETESKATLTPERAVPARSGESYKEDKTNQQDQPTKAEHASAASEAIEPGNDGWLDGPRAEPPSAADGPDPDGVRVLRSLPLGVGDKLAGHAVTRWSHVVGAALRSGMDERTVIAKLTDTLPTGSVAQRVRIVVGRRLPDLAADVEQAATRAADRERTAEDRANAKVDQWANQGAHGARQAAGLLGLYFDPEAQRGSTPAQEWLTERLPAISREFVEQHRADLIAALTSRHAA